MITFKFLHSMVHKTFCFLICVLLFLFVVGNHAKAQSIIAGMHTPNEVYVDFVPDSIQMAVAAHVYNPGYNLSLDIDSDGTDDVIINSSGGGGLGGGSASCTLYPIRPNVEIAAYLDTFQICCPMDVYRFVATGFNIGDSISDQNDFVSDNIFIWSDSYGMSSSPYIANWLNTGVRCVGLRICYSFDTLYCWIRINVTYSTYFQVEIMDFACNRNSSIGISTPGFPLPYAFYPRPFSNELFIDIADASEHNIVLYNVEGKKIFQDKIIGQRRINTESLSSGIYFYELSKNDLIVGRGKIFKN
ncbi:hypothetical protein BH11BAC1_BH11BAC1_25920 [soil metagenome]